MFFNPNIYEAINLAIILTSSFYYFGVISVDFIIYVVIDFLNT